MADFYASNMIYFMSKSQITRAGIFNKIIKQIFGFEKLSFEIEIEVDVSNEVLEGVLEGKEVVEKIKKTQSFVWTEEELKIFENI